MRPTVRGQRSGWGEGILVSSATVAEEERRLDWPKAYDAIAVDMEAAAVAQGAEARGVGFAAVKAISDRADFSMPAKMERFVATDGRFRSAKFAGHVVLRPWLWASTIALARNSAKASRPLCAALASYLDREAQSHSAMGDASSGSVLNPMTLIQPINQPSASAHTTTSRQPHTRVTGQQ